MTRACGFLLLIAWCGSSPLSACSIPVFRYALERWESDRYQVIVFHRGPMGGDHEAAVTNLVKQSAVLGGPLNIELIRYDLAAESPPKLLDAEPPPPDQPLPYVEVRDRVGGTKWMRRWQGTLSDALRDNRVFDSAARQEVVRRILQGHSAVWLLVAPTAERAARDSEILQQRLDQAAKQMVLPDGIGLPGSELSAPVPLEIRFSVVPTFQGSDAEAPLLQMLATHAKEWSLDQSYAVPVFGRGRALEIFQLDELDDDLVGEVTGFLCGACSCQVKQANPGFDLLLSVNWEEQMFGVSASSSNPTDSAPSPAIDSAEANPDLVAIAPGGSPPMPELVLDITKSGGPPTVGSDLPIRTELESDSHSNAPSATEDTTSLTFTGLVGIAVVLAVALVSKLLRK